jgi:hypothetical protein
MRTRLAMVACYGPHVGPWLRARGNEVGVRVKCLGEGEIVTVQAQLHPELEPVETVIRAEGDFPIPEKFTRIRFKKEGGAKPTSVELVVNG